MEINQVSGMDDEAEYDSDEDEVKKKEKERNNVEYVY